MIIKDGSYWTAYRSLEKLDIPEKDFKYVIDEMYSPVNYLFRYPKHLNSNIASALEKKLTGNEALIEVEKDIFLCSLEDKPKK